MKSPSCTQDAEVLWNIALIEENFKRIADNISFTWGYPECKEYMLRLVMDSRDGERHGFHQDVMQNIMNLIQLYQDQFEGGYAG